MNSYEQTFDSFREAISLGFSVSEVINQLESNENTNLKALEELRYYQKYGI